MDNTKPVKTPKVILRNFKGGLIASTIEGLPLGIVSMRYKFDDEDDDRCFIKIQATDARYINVMNLNRGDILYVSWGYIEGSMSWSVPIVVRDIKSKYGANVTYTELECTDFATFLKITKSQDSVKLSLIDYIKVYCAGKLKVIIKEGGNILYKQAYKVPYIPDYETILVSEDNANFPKDPFGAIGFSVGGKFPLTEREKELSLKHSAKEIQVETEEYEMGLWFDSESPVRKYLEEEIDLVTTNRSPFVVISERMRLCPNGPWYVSGRGSTLFIHNRHLAGVPVRSYKYKKEPGNLIDFEAKTKYESFEKRTATQHGIDPLSKSVHFIDAYLEQLGKMRNLKDIIEDKNHSKEDKKKELMEWMIVQENGYQKFRTGELPVEFLASGEVNIVKQFTEAGYPFGNPVYNQKQKEESSRDSNSAVKSPDLIKFGSEQSGGINSYAGKVVTPILIIGTGYTYSAPVASWDDAANHLANRLRGLEMEKEEGKFIIEGDPDLINNIVVNVGNVQLAHLGNYYVKTCEHHITKQGYKVVMDGFKVVEEAKIKTYHEEGKQEEDIDGLKFNAEERFLLEENVFRKWAIKILIGVIETTTYGVGGYTNPGNTKEEEVWVNLSTIKNKDGTIMRIDQKAEYLINLEKNGLKVKFEPNVETR